MASSAPAKSTKLELSALIVGIVAFVSAFIPYVNWITWLLGAAGLILSLAAIMKAETKQNRLKPIIGLVLSLFSGSIGIFMSKMYAPMLGTALFATAV